ncbi:MAG: glycosyltransferase family 39 protein [Bacteroidia bacterium]|nr:glycosyltransferase family 39 protein [Bacteroidia bacterium]
MNQPGNSIYTTFRTKWISDIRFWILLFFVIRLYGITDAPIEVAHNWRQTFTNLVARSFLEVDPNILYPKAPIYGNNSGVVGTEFPLLNYFIFLIAKLAGYAHWYGRLINLIVTSIGLYYFFKIVERYINYKIAFNATMILMCSIWFIFARKSMPDTFSISILLIGLYYGLTYFRTGAFYHIFLYLLFASIGILCKIPGLYLLGIFLLPFIDSNIPAQRKLIFGMASVVVLGLVYFWYFQWVPYLESIEGNQLYFPRSLQDGFVEVMDRFGLTLERFYFSSFQSFVAFAFFLAGLYFMIRHKQNQALLVYSALTFVFVLFILKTGFVFPLHSYYIVPYTPVMVIIAAYALEQIKNNRYRTIALFVLVVEALANQQDDLRWKESEAYKLKLEEIAERVTNANELIAINGGESPQQIYFTHRKGWRLSNEQVLDKEFIQQIAKQGCKCLFLNKNEIDVKAANLDLVPIYEDAHYIVYQL